MSIEKYYHTNIIPLLRKFETFAVLWANLKLYITFLLRDRKPQIPLKHKKRVELMQQRDV